MFCAKMLRIVDGADERDLIMKGLLGNETRLVYYDSNGDLDEILLEYGDKEAHVTGFGPFSEAELSRETEEGGACE